MTKEEIDILWNKALRESIDDGSLYTRYRFAELVAEAERNECAKIVDGNADGCTGIIEQILRSNAAAIRARSNT